MPERYGQTDGRTDRQTDRQNCYINIARQCADARASRVSVLTHDKNQTGLQKLMIFSVVAF